MSSGWSVACENLHKRQQASIEADIDLEAGMIPAEIGFLSYHNKTAQRFCRASAISMYRAKSLAVWNMTPDRTNRCIFHMSRPAWS